MADSVNLYSVYGTKGLYYKAYETISELLPAWGLNTFRKMRMNDPVIGGIIFHLNSIIEQTEFTFEGNVPDFVESSIGEKGFLTQLIEDMLSVLVYGFYCGEKIWKADRYVRLVDVEPRHQTTITYIEDNYIVQTPHDKPAKQPVIPKEKLVLFYLQSDGRYPYGISLLRPVYKPYFMKTALEARLAEKLDEDITGRPVLTSPPGFNFAAASPDYPGGSDKSIKATLDWAKDVVGEKGQVLPDGWVLNALDSHIAVDIDSVIKRYNTEICMGMLEMFMVASLGLTVHKDSATNYLDTLLSATNGIAKKLAEVINEQIITQLFKYNGRKRVTCKIKAKNTINYNIKDLAGFVARLVAQGVINPTPQLEESLLSIANLDSPVIENKSPKQDLTK